MRESEGDPVSTTRPLEGRRILVVEDSYIQAAHTSTWLVEAGARVLGPVANARTAKELLDAGEVDAAVLDLDLGQGPDYGIAERLADQGVPFVFATAYEKEEIDFRFRNAPYVSKPFSRDNLVRTLLALN
jgi:CheY-like chemotaxis protein